MTATYTDAEMLELVREAIAAIVSGRAQEVNLPGGRGTRMLSLRELREQEAYYQARVSSANKSVSTIVQI